MRVRDGVLNVVVIFPTLALCVSCTGTWFNWRRDLKKRAAAAFVKWGDRLLSSKTKVAKFTRLKDFQQKTFFLISSFIFPDSFGPFFIWLPRKTIEESPEFKSAVYVTDLSQFPTTSKTPSLSRIDTNVVINILCEMATNVHETIWLDDQNYSLFCNYRQK